MTDNSHIKSSNPQRGNYPLIRWLHSLQWNSLSLSSDPPLHDNSAVGKLAWSLGNPKFLCSDEQREARQWDLKYSLYVSSAYSS